MILLPEVNAGLIMKEQGLPWSEEAITSIRDEVTVGKAAPKSLAPVVAIA
jgi:hypothetical protein